MTVPLMVAFYQDTPLTNGTYVAHARRLQAECAAAGQPVDIMERNYGTDYLSICRGKPAFMLEQLDKHGTVVYVDVDSHVLKAWPYPPSERIGWARKPNGRPHDYLHYLPDNAGTRAFIAAWQAILDDGWEGGDHSAMWLASDRLQLEWDALPNVESVCTYGIADSADRDAAKQHLNAIGWRDKLRQRLAE